MNRIIISIPLCFIMTGVYTSQIAHATEFNTIFLHGTSDIPSILKGNVRYPAGEYYADVSLNGNKTGKLPLTISVKDEKAEQLCLSSEWLQKAGVFFKPEIYENTFNKERGCYMPGIKKGIIINFELNEQALDFVIPQAWLLEKNDAARWDYGVNGLRLAYNGNFNKNMQTRNNEYYNETLNAYGNINGNLNLGRWVLSADLSAAQNVGGNEFDANNLILSTAVSQFSGDFQIGRTQTRTELFQDFGFYGASLRSNSNMRPQGSRGYAPVVTGVASSTSRITITQGGNTVYSRVVPPGPYQLTDITSVSNGNLIVTVEDNRGQKTVTEYPVATLPSLLRPGEFNYNIALGERSDSNKVKDAFTDGNGIFSLASLDYGLASTTVNSAMILHSNYQAGGVGITQSLGTWGAFSAAVNASNASYYDESNRKGVSSTIKYAKSFTDRTDLQLLTYRYQSPGYVEFSSWIPDEKKYRNDFNFYGNEGEYRYSYLSGREKARYEARVSHRFDNLYLSGSYWQQSYWDSNRDAAGLFLSASTYLKNGISVFMSGNYSRNSWGGKEDFSSTISLNIPFTFSEIYHHGSGSMSYSRNGATAFNSSVSATVDERLNYSINAGSDSHQNSSIGASASYAFNTVQTNMALAQNRDTTTLSGNVSGAAIATKQTGLILTKEAANTVAVVKLKNIPGVTFNHSLPTNSSGNTVLYLSEYNPTSININPENVPESTELLNSSFKVIPTEKAIIYREFDYQNIRRYILRIKDSEGRILSGGTASTEQGLNAGFISNNGVLLMNLLAPPKKITITDYNKKICSFNSDGLKENTGRVQEIRCE